MADPAAAGPIISRENLAAHASANTPLEWPLAEFCKYVTHDRAGLEDFLLSNVPLARLCQAKTHKYVILKVECAHLFGLNSDIWMRCERRPARGPRAADIVTISFEEAKVSQTAERRKSMGTQGLQFSDVVVLWRIIEEEDFGLASQSSSWFASVIWENLTQLFPAELTFTTRNELIGGVTRSVGPARATEPVTRMFLARSRAVLEPTTFGSHRLGTTDSDGGMSISDRGSLFSSPRGRASPAAPMISAARQSWGEGGELYQSPESLAGYQGLPIVGDTPGVPVQANYRLLPKRPIGDSLHTVRASQGQGQDEQSHLVPDVQENGLGLFIPQTPGHDDQNRLPTNHGEDREDVGRIPRPFQQVDYMPPASPTSTTWAILIDELRQATDVQDLSGQLDHTRRKWVAAGGYSDVFLTYWRSPTQASLIPVCYKVLRPINDLRPVQDGIQKVIKRLKREMRSWKDLNHPHIVRFIGFSIEYQSYGTTAALVSEWCGYGHVINYLRGNATADRHMLVSDIAQGLGYLHSQDPPIVHGDLKPQNVLVTDAGRAQLCDFGLSRVLDGRPSGNTTSVQGGTMRYLAPELLGGIDPNKEMRRTTESDVFAFACTCVQILFDYQPYYWCNTDYLVIKEIEHNQSPWPWGDSLLERVLASCCSQSGSHRPSMLRVMAILPAYPPYS